jgi:hypothetical protein
MTTQQEYLLTQIEQRKSLLNSGDYWRFTWMGIDDGVQYESTIDPTYKNFYRNHWDQLVKANHYQGIYSGLKPTDRKTKLGVSVLNADSGVKCEQLLDQHEVELVLTALSEREQSPKDHTQPHWDRLFVFEEEHKT